MFDKLTALKLAAHVPAFVWKPLGAAAAAVLVARRPRPIRQWQLNYEVVCGAVPTASQTRAGMRSWLRNTIGSLQLGKWNTDKINRLVYVAPVDARRLRRHRAETGLILALPHMGSWDMAGAWACQNGLPVTSVAEKLPAGQFEYFSAIREKLGFKIFSHKTSGLIPKLCQEINEGRVVALVADRDFSRRGVEVSWPAANKTYDLTMPPGCALIAQRTGAVVVPVAPWFDGKIMRIHIGQAIEVPEGVDEVAYTTQAMANYFAEQIAAHCRDWHMLQRFFPGVRP
ncbi:phosphatidylinositol mannoside acyltransferase [Propionimicrobium lymphophilum]|uniref:phosphatidylinositol mannoside acyltransferase n=1 Tax=Propionimicrobium lymphophilum TaxID=33012 RepID=UPI003EC58564